MRLKSLIQMLTEVLHQANNADLEVEFKDCDGRISPIMGLQVSIQTGRKTGMIVRLREEL